MLIVLKFNWIPSFYIAAFPFNYEIQTVLAIFRLECSPGWCGNKGIIYCFSVSTRREERGIYFNNSHIISLPAFPGWWRQTLLQPKPRGVLPRLEPDHTTVDKVVAMIQLQHKVVICLFGSGKSMYSSASTWSLEQASLVWECYNEVNSELSSPLSIWLRKELGEFQLLPQLFPGGNVRDTRVGDMLIKLS